MSGEAGEELDSPAARIRARRESRAAMPDRLKEAAADDSSDGEWIADDLEDQEEDVRWRAAASLGKLGTYAVPAVPALTLVQKNDIFLHF